MVNTAFLDIDDSLRAKNLLLPDEERDALNSQMDELMKQFNPESSILVQPTPGICVKTKTTDGKKVFLNMCVSDKIPPPEDISDARLFELLDDEVPAFTIPMSIGAERMEADKLGAPCATYDIMINPTYLKKCQEKKQFMAFTLLVVLNAVTNKSGKELNLDDYIILKNRTVMGKLQQHRIQNREPHKLQSYKPLIEEISNPLKAADRKTHSQDSNKQKRTGYVILREPSQGPIKHLIALFDMPNSVSIKDIVVLINSERINVTDEKGCSYDILLPYKLKIDNAKAHLDYNIGMLRVDIWIE